jgi:hypothetical protein
LAQAELVVWLRGGARLEGDVHDVRPPSSTSSRYADDGGEARAQAKKAFFRE